jgi:hypothetical protein
MTPRAAASDIGREVEEPTFALAAPDNQVAEVRRPLDSIDQTCAIRPTARDWVLDPARAAIRPTRSTSKQKSVSWKIS